MVRACWSLEELLSLHEDGIKERVASALVAYMEHVPRSKGSNSGVGRYWGWMTKWDCGRTSHCNNALPSPPSVFARKSEPVAPGSHSSTQVTVSVGCFDTTV